ncbi:uncharacterized protein si:ch1073-67j19.2 [Danio aesculapii]|uniref:uncharacterized protein si:ch1073-67j19.2 n=1 Tax=Danio aesculapii TaxID=1142201 RepID=UPI0024BF8020|nr:uncharacterized protein si:ch1073-67j19.2 [Danio aesculapii]
MKTVAILYFCISYFRYTHCSSPSDSLDVTSVEDVYNYLWENNKDIAAKTLHLDFLRQMENGTLQAERYVNFTIQDLNYALKVGDMLKKMSANESLPTDIKMLLEGRYTSYRKLSDFMMKIYWFEAEPSIQQTPAMRNYLSFYTNLMLTEEPVYFVVGLVPCARLWGWLANNLNIPPTNAYFTWKVGNMGGNHEKHYKALLNKYLNTADKVAKANAVFREQMQNEHDFFLTF